MLQSRWDSLVRSLFFSMLAATCSFGIYRRCAYFFHFRIHVRKAVTWHHAAFHWSLDVRTNTMLKHTELCIFLCKLVHIKPCTWSRAMPYSALHAMMCCHTNKNSLFPLSFRSSLDHQRNSFSLISPFFKYFFSRFNPPPPFFFSVIYVPGLRTNIATD